MGRGKYENNNKENYKDNNSKNRVNNGWNKMNT